MVTHTPARLFMMTGEAGTGKTTDVRMLAQILGLPYYVFTCGPGTDELELLASTVPNMETKKGRCRNCQIFRTFRWILPLRFMY